MARGENTSTSETIRRITPDEWGMASSKREIVEGKYVLMERVIHWWGNRIVNGVRQLEEGIQQVFIAPHDVERLAKQGDWKVVEDEFDQAEALRKDQTLLDGDGNEIKRARGRKKD
jgi:hypothetical protein